MLLPETITQKIREVQAEMKRSGIWKTTHPEWVARYAAQRPESAEDFSDWLQFVYLPNRLQEAGEYRVLNQYPNVVPQAVKFFGADIKKGKLLQLLIELDSLS